MAAVFAMLLLVVASVQAQPRPKAYKRSGLDYFAEEQYERAVTALETYYATDPGDDDIWYALASSYYYTNQLAKAAELFDGILRASRSAKDEVYLLRGRTAHYLGDFATAARYYKRYLAAIDRNHSRYASIVDDIRRVGYAERLGPSGGAVAAYSENLGSGINTVADDFHPLLSPNYQDRMYFASTRLPREEDFLTLSTGRQSVQSSRRSDMYAARIQNGRWQTGEALSYLLNSDEYDVPLDFTDRGKVLIYWQGSSLFSGDLRLDTFRSSNEARPLAAPRWLDSPLRAHKGDKDPYLFMDSVMLFASQRDGGYGGFDLYVSIRRGGVWQPPKNLGPTVNSAYDERTPFLARDGRTLYFSSNRADRSVGGFDVLTSTYEDGTTSWTEVRNLGLSINSAGNELNFRLSASGLEAFFDSDDRGQSLGGRDLFVAYFKEQLTEQSAQRDPVSFAQVEEQALLAELLRMQQGTGTAPQNGLRAAEKIPLPVVLNTLPYEDDNSVTAIANMERARSVIQLLEDYPGARVVITSHADESEPERFRAYFGIKRAEKFAQALVDRGISADRIQVMSVGSAYPIARNFVDGEPSALGQRTNRRLELHVIPPPEYRLEPSYEIHKLPQVLRRDRDEVYHNTQRGLSFRIEVAEQAQNYDNTDWLKLPAPTVQADGLGGTYRFSAGTYNSYFAARQFADELQRNGFMDARVVAYIDGRRVAARELPNYTQLYPELNSLLND